MARGRGRGQAGGPSARGHVDRRRGDRTGERGRRGLDREGQALPRRGVAAGHERPCHRRGAARGRPARRRGPGRGGDPCARSSQGSRAACRDHLADLSVVGPASAGRRSGRVPGHAGGSVARSRPRSMSCAARSRRHSGTPHPPSAPRSQRAWSHGRSGRTSHVPWTGRSPHAGGTCPRAVCGRSSGCYRPLRRWR